MAGYILGITVSTMQKDTKARDDSQMEPSRALLVLRFSRSFSPVPPRRLRAKTTTAAPA